MPYKSAKQRRYMYANHPEIAKKWAKEGLGTVVKKAKKNTAKLKKKLVGYKKVVDNKMRDYGDTDLGKKIIRINKSKKKNKKRGDIIDSIVHEENHVKHPKMHERNIRKKTKSDIKRMKSSIKKKLYSSYK